MIRSFRLRNFKAFEDTGDIGLKPLTVLAGVNSGGKSSILQGLLLLKQTLDQEPRGGDLNLGGPLVEASSLRDLTHGKPPLNQCEIGFSFLLDFTIPKKVTEEYFPDFEWPGSDEEMPIQTAIDYTFGFKTHRSGKKCIIVTECRVAPRLGSGTDAEMLLQLRKGHFKVRMRGCRLPQMYRKKAFVDAWGYSMIPYFLVPKPPQSDGGDKAEREPMALPSLFRAQLASLERSLTSDIVYLGPLREEPRRAYLRSSSGIPGIGRKGENAAQILWLEKDEEIEYVPVGASEPVKTRLIDAVCDVFGTMGLSASLSVSAEKSMFYQVLLDIATPRGKGDVTIADVGFGVSQLLPIVMVGLRSDPGDLLVFEQPEIHLHPMLQANLADFLIALTRQGKRILLETHSDHIIHRLRRRAAEDAADQLKDQISILFVRPGTGSGGSLVEPLTVDQYGQISNWPPDFLPEAAMEAEATLKAGIKKRTGGRGNAADRT